MTVFKVVAKTDKEDIFESAVVFDRKARLKYKIGKTTKAKFGGILCFDKYSHAENFMDYNQHTANTPYIILKGRAKGRIKAIYLTYCSASFNELKATWTKPYPSLGIPEGTVAYKEFTPEREICQS